MSKRIEETVAVKDFAPKRLRKAYRLILGALGLGATFAGSAFAETGASYLQIPGVSGSEKSGAYKNWVKTDGYYWDAGRRGFGGPGGPGGAGGIDPAQIAQLRAAAQARAAAVQSRQGRAAPQAGQNRLASGFYNGPAGPASGAGKLVVGFNKDSRDLPKLMQMCARKAALPVLNYAEISRNSSQIGPRPASVPEYFEYRMRDVEVVDCPVIAAAPQQAIVFSFKSIERSNYQGDGAPVEFREATLAELAPASLANPAKSRSYVLSWFAAATDAAPDQCPVMNKKPTEAEYYALMSPEDVAKERAENAKRGGVTDFQMAFRGPHKLDVNRLPGIIADPGNAAPQTKVALGFNLDGNDGTGKLPRGVRKHLNYVSPDGRTGIDNQLYTSVGCISSFRGRTGFIWQFFNGQMRDGLMSMLVEVVGIDNDKNDDSVEVIFTNSTDRMSKSADGTTILPDNTFHPSDLPLFTHFYRRIKARIVNGVVESDPVDLMSFNLGPLGVPSEVDLHQARLRLEFKPDGGLKGLVGGYLEWKPIVSRYISSLAESTHGFQVPGLYNAMRRNADGLQNPVTGEFEGISAAYEFDGVSAFISPPEPPQKDAPAAQPPVSASPPRAQ